MTVADQTRACAAVTIVDDQLHPREVLLRAVQSWNYEGQWAASAEAALTLLDRRPTPVVITDLSMPGKGGLWLIREIQRRWPSISVMVVTAGADPDGQARCLDAGAQHYFLKPINFSQFHHALTMTLGPSQAGAGRESRLRWLEQALDRQRGKQRRTVLSAVASLARTLEARDAYTSGHSMRVRSLVLRLAKGLGLDMATTRKLSLAAKLHDLGKVGLPEGILNKAGALTVKEYALVMEHPAIGERILRPIIRDRAILGGIRGHHERHDGGGYPDGLRGERVPFLARVIAVADCFDALTSGRPYRLPMSAAAALEVIRRGAGTQFDPRVARSFVEGMQVKALENSD